MVEGRIYPDQLDAANRMRDEGGLALKIAHYIDPFVAAYMLHINAVRHDSAENFKQRINAIAGFTANSRIVKNLPILNNLSRGWQAKLLTWQLYDLGTAVHYPLPILHEDPRDKELAGMVVQALRMDAPQLAESINSVRRQIREDTTS